MDPLTFQIGLIFALVLIIVSYAEEFNRLISTQSIHFLSGGDEDDPQKGSGGVADHQPSQ